MTDWIQVLLGQPLEEAREDGLEELNQAAEDILIRKRQALRQADRVEDLPAGQPAAERPAQAHLRRPPEALEGQSGEPEALDEAREGRRGAAHRNEEALKQKAGEEDEPEAGQTMAAADQGADRLNSRLQKSLPGFRTPEVRQTEQGKARSAGAQAALGVQEEARVWQQSGTEALEAASAGGQAEWAASETARQSSSGSGYLAAALAAPEYRTPSAGRLLAAMERNDRAAAYQTTARITEQAENSAWTGSDPERLDQFFERDARRYDNGFTMF